MVFLACCVCTFFFAYRWCRFTYGCRLPLANKPAKIVLGLLPGIALVLFLITMLGFAASDVVSNGFYIIFYVIMGFAWLLVGLFFVSAVFNLSWIDDCLHLNNRAALLAFCGAFLGTAVIYCGANVGEGPGWWCVVFAGGLGGVAWLLLGWVLGKLTRLFERVTVERDLGCGIRTGFYLLATGIILAKASSGDWTSFGMTVVEFADGWIAVPLTLLAFAVERVYLRAAAVRRKNAAISPMRYEGGADNPVPGSVAIGLAYVAAAIAAVVLLPPLVGGLL